MIIKKKEQGAETTEEKESGFRGVFFISYFFYLSDIVELALVGDLATAGLGDLKDWWCREREFFIIILVIIVVVSR